MNLDLIDGNDQPPTVFQRHGNELATLFDLVSGAIEGLQDVVRNGRRETPQPLLIDLIAFDGRQAERGARPPAPAGDETVTMRQGPGAAWPCGDMPAKFPGAWREDCAWLDRADAGRWPAVLANSPIAPAGVAGRPRRACFTIDPTQNIRKKLAAMANTVPTQPGPARTSERVLLWPQARAKTPSRAIAPNVCRQHCDSRNARAQRRQPPGSLSSLASSSRRSSSLNSPSTSRSKRDHPTAKG